jgi:hypothetical protein
VWTLIDELKEKNDELLQLGFRRSE